MLESDIQAIVLDQEIFWPNFKPCKGTMLSSLSLHMWPSKSASMSFEISKGQSVSCYAKIDDFLYVIDDSNSERLGWVPAEYVELVGE
ncbi:MAG: hypothetical protein LKE17_00030 [Lactobacillus sp.]|jgi:hypothetical protein|nr:hypothetical protein [Lactobacillus sp.]